MLKGGNVIELAFSVDVDQAVSHMYLIVVELYDPCWLPRTGRNKCWPPIPAEIGLLFTNKPSIDELIELLHTGRPDFLSGLICDVVCNLGRGAEIDTQHTVLYIALIKKFCNIEPILPKLIICARDMLPAKVNGSKSVETVEQKPCARGAWRQT